MAEDRVLPTLKELFQMGSTFVLVIIGWIIFRASTIGDFWQYLKSMMYNWNVTETLEGKKTLLFISIMLLVEWFNRKKEHAFAFNVKSVYLRWGIYILVALLCLTQAGKQVLFIYFQF